MRDPLTENGVTSGLRVLLIGPSPPPYGGMALQARQLVSLLRRDGADVTFVPSNPCFPERFRWLSHIRGLRTVFRSTIIWIRLWRVTRQVDVVHVLACSWIYFFAVVYPAIVLGRALGKRTVLNYRGGDAATFFARWGWLITPAFRMASAVTAPSGFLARTIRDRLGVGVRIVPNFVNTSAFKYRRRPTCRPKLLSARHLETIYDIETVLKAFGAIQERYPEASLIVAGSGTQGEYLQNLARALRLQNVRFLGAVEHADLPDIYDSCDILLNASRVDNFPGALLEASAAGLVVVSTAAGGIPFLYSHDQTALLVEPGDGEGLAAAVCRLLESPALAAALSNNGAALARAFDWTAVRRELYSAYGVRPEGPAEHSVVEKRCWRAH